MAFNSSPKASAKTPTKRPAQAKPNASNKKAKTTTAAPPRQRRHADIVEEAKVLWNKLRVKTNSPEQTRELLDQLIPLIQNKACQIALQHDASRVVQAVFQFGSPEERASLLKELLEDGTTFLELCKSQYAHFLVLKVIKYCHKEHSEQILKAFRGHMSKLAVHAVGARVLESLFNTFTPKQTAFLKQEFYGPHVTIFASEQSALEEAPTLRKNIEKLPEKKDKTIAAIGSLVNKGAKKMLYGLTFFQELMFEYLSEVDPKEIRAFAATAEIVHLTSSRPGAQAGALLISYGTAKDRKRMLKSLKGFTLSALLHPDAYLMIIRLVELTDDTVSVQKNLLNELVTAPPESENQDSPLLKLAVGINSSKLFRLLLAPESRQKLFDPFEHSVLFENPTVKEDGDEVPTSKKEASVRRQELLKFLREPLEQLCTKHALDLMKSQPGSYVLRDVYAAFRSNEVVKAVIEACRQESSILDDFHGHLSIKNIVLSDVGDSEALFSSMFIEAFSDDLTEICETNRGAFIVEALYKVPTVQKLVKKKIDKKKIKQKSRGDGPTAGFKALLAVL
ncbi:pumilio homology domain family member 6 [Fistulifera solaris]|uniref:Pumilio homology domain family member 6 n=1 Tax=Fistulifera solaris TaxID=1519565 RepID=A0A1Z5JE79_FISSO|nr:pumilio homology domain family member 6 [Fistulifera solaris]|eukprot:GAX12303.1 pumilio homology domain family member 6 [Fistulifera solaris]